VRRYFVFSFVSSAGGAATNGTPHHLSPSVASLIPTLLFSCPWSPGCPCRVVLKISVDHDPLKTTMRLDGRVVGPWVDELRSAWNSLAAALGSRKLAVDLRGVTHMSGEGQKVLAEIHNMTGADFLADSPLTQYFAEQARRPESL
jgi:hypothetical protein